MMDNRQTAETKGFTLVELVIAVAISGLLISFLSQVVIMAVQAYGINLENSDAMTKITPVLKRIETEITESPYARIVTASAVVPSGGTTTFTAVTVLTQDSSGADVSYQFFWDKEGDGSPAAGALTDSSKSIYRVSGSAIDVILAANGKVPAALVTKYGDNWNSSYIKVKDFYFQFFRDGASSGSTRVWSAGDGAENIKYMKIHVELEGSIQQSSFKLDTGFRIK